MRQRREAARVPLAYLASRFPFSHTSMIQADIEWLYKLADGLGVRASALLREPPDDNK